MAYDYQRTKTAMSLAEAKDTLGFTPRSTPTNDEVNQAFRTKYIENRKTHPDSGGDPELATKLNVAKDTLQGKLRPDRGTPGYQPPRDTQREEEARKQHDEYKRKESKPTPPPPGSSLSSALPSGVDWRVLSDSTYEQEWVTDDDGDAYQAVTRLSVAFGKNSSGYVAARISSVSHGRSRVKSVTAYTAQAMSFPAKVAFLKIAPKTVKEMLGKAAFRRPKFKVLSGTLASSDMTGFTLSLKDAVLGSELVDASQDSSLKNRKIQVEIEPILDKARLKAWRASGAMKNQKLYTVYDWILYINGKKSQLTPQEVEGIHNNSFIFVVYGYDYTKGRKNITKMRGGRMKASAAEGLKYLADGLKSGPAKQAVLLAAEQQTKVKKAYSYERVT